MPPSTTAEKLKCNKGQQAFLSPSVQEKKKQILEVSPPGRMSARVPSLSTQHGQLRNKFLKAIPEYKANPPPARTVHLLLHWCNLIKTLTLFIFEQAKRHVLLASHGRKHVALRKSNVR